MKKQFVPYEQALELNELGFNEPCLGRWLIIKEMEAPTGEIELQIGVIKEDYDKDQFYAPLYQQAFAWFRENYNFHHYIEPINRDGKVRYEYCAVDSSDDDKEFNEDVAYEYEDAEFKCLKELINLIKNK